jgi:hypothetical protein
MSQEERVEFSLAGRVVQIGRDDIIRAASDPRISGFRYKTVYVEIGNEKYPTKGLISLATGIPTEQFSTSDAKAILKKLGFKVVEVR